MSCPEDRATPSRLPRPSPVGSLVEAPSRGLSPHSPLASGSRIPRLVTARRPRDVLNASFTVPERHARTLSPRTPERPVGTPEPVHMMTLPPNNTEEYAGEGSTVGSPRQATPGGRTPSRLPRPSPGGSTLGAQPSRGLSPHSPLAWGSRIPRLTTSPFPQDILNESFTVPEHYARTDHAPCDGADFGSPTGRPQQERAVDLNRQLDLQDVCSEEEEEPEDGVDLDTTIGSYHTAAADCSFTTDDNEYYEPEEFFEEGDVTLVNPTEPLPGTSGQQTPFLGHAQEEYCDDDGARALPPNFTAEDLRFEDAVVDYLLHPPRTQEPVPGCQLGPPRPGESMEEFTRRNMDSLARLKNPPASLKPIPGFRVDPRPGESREEFVHRNRQAEDEWAAVAPPLMYTYGRRPDESWEQRDARSQQLIDQYWQATLRSRERDQQAGVEYLRLPDQLDQLGRAHGRLAELTGTGPTQQGFMNLMSAVNASSSGGHASTSRGRAPTSRAHASTSRGRTSTSRGHASSSGAYAQEGRRAHDGLMAQMAMGPTVEYIRNLEMEEGHASTSGGHTTPSGGCIPRRPLSPPVYNRRRRATANSSQNQASSRPRRSPNEDFFGLSSMDDDDCTPPPSSSQQRQRTDYFQAPSLPPISEVQYQRSPSPPPLPPVRPRSPQPGPSRSGGRNRCIPTNVANLLDDYANM